MKLKSDRDYPEFIKCSDLAKIGYPYTYEILERGLEAIGWRYDINKDRWYPPSGALDDYRNSLGR